MTLTRNQKLVQQFETINNLFQLGKLETAWPIFQRSLVDTVQWVLPRWIESVVVVLYTIYRVVTVCIAIAPIIFTRRLKKITGCSIINCTGCRRCAALESDVMTMDGRDIHAWFLDTSATTLYWQLVPVWLFLFRCVKRGSWREIWEERPRFSHISNRWCYP